MPELPEVEITARGIKKYTQGKTIKKIRFFREKIRYPLDPSWPKKLTDQHIKSVNRRAKTIIMTLDKNILLWHLGMTGSLRISEHTESKRKHDHIEFLLDNQRYVRFHDPRRFGYLQCFDNQEQCDEQFKKYGLEPLSEAFNGEYLWEKSRKKTQNIKSFIMNQHNIVGVGNIYACESLFLSSLSPLKPCGKISKKNYHQLAIQIKAVLKKAIKQGGTTLSDFENAEAKPGYFQQSLLVYGKEGKPCNQCGSEIKNKKIAQRSSFFCAICQK